VSSDLLLRYPFLESPFIGEIFCRLAYLYGPIPAYSVPSNPPGRSIPDVLIATSASLVDKLWTLDGWRQALAWLRARGLTVGLLGAKPSDQNRYWEGAAVEARLVEEGLADDLRGAFTLPQVVGALSKCQFVLTLDNGILHLACAARKSTIGLFREGIHRLWAPPFDGLRVIHSAPGTPVSTVEPNVVLESLEEVLFSRGAS
jgi:ADP-heptose:LPS heptosyltransferase